MTLSPVNPHVAVFPAYIASEPTTMNLTGAIFHISESFTVETNTGQPIFTITNSPMSMSERKEIHDAQNRHIFTVRKENLSMLGEYYAETPAGQEIFAIKGKLTFVHTKLVAEFLNVVTGSQEGLSIKTTGFAGVDADVVSESSGQVVAHIEGTALSARGRFAVSVAPGVDLALIVAIFLAWDGARKK